MDEQTCSLAPCQCKLDVSEIGDKLNYDVNIEDIWIEKDGQKGRTSPSEYVSEGQAVEKEVTIQLKCASCKCESNEFVCTKNDSCGE